MITFTDVSFSNLFHQFWNSSIPINLIQSTKNKTKGMNFDYSIPWSTQEFPEFLSQTLNEDPWERIINLKKIYYPIPLKFPLIANYLGINKIFDIKTILTVLETIQEVSIQHLRLIHPLNDIKILDKLLKIDFIRNFEIDGTVVVNPHIPETEYLKQMLQLYKSYDLSKIVLYDPTGQISIRYFDQLVKILEKFNNFTFCLSIAGKSEKLHTLVRKFVESNIVLENIDVTYISNYPEPSPPKLLTLLELFEEMGIKTRITLKDLKKIQTNICLKQFEEKACNERDDTYRRRIETRNFPQYLIYQLSQVLKDNNKEKFFSNVLNEITITQKDLGFPPLIPPFTDIILSQALFNISSSGDRYETLTPDIHAYLSGYFGDPHFPIEESLLQRKRMSLKPYSLSIEKIEKEIIPKKNAWSLSRNDLLTYLIATKESEIFFDNKFNNQPDEIDITSSKFLATIVMKILMYLDPIQKLEVNSKKNAKSTENIWGLTGRLDQMSSW